MNRANGILCFQLLIGLCCLSGCAALPTDDDQRYLLGMYDEMLVGYEKCYGSVEGVPSGYQRLDRYCRAAYAAKFYDRLEACLRVSEQRAKDHGSRAQADLLEIRAQYALDTGDYSKAISDARQLLRGHAERDQREERGEPTEAA